MNNLNEQDMEIIYLNHRLNLLKEDAEKYFNEFHPELVATELDFKVLALKFIDAQDDNVANRNTWKFVIESYLATLGTKHFIRKE